ncbi:low temperature requirement protein A [Nocardiopsis sp. FIRDI 009]|uniref:low temperature requirement protein A n=1 Tax=Nocardiopsis sp. FIRDI 009 TaxID=714197 RepID=UPI001E359E8E|nr:low temperature requirement protein A [Nocardiopsis sp. FIRDI 009]
MTSRLIARMVPRRTDEEHRAATPLELFFDLCFVVAVAQAAVGLLHAIADGHAGAGTLGYAFVFFGIWWAWMNFTWFASAYDCDDVPYRLLTLVQMAGVLVYAAGVSRAFDGDWTLTVIGYLIMRVALTAQWLRAARGETDAGARTARRYALGLILCQSGWVVLLLVPEGVQRWLFVVLALAELSVPVIAERARRTPWHPHHIAERYGLFTIIVLGETILAATVAVRSGLDDHHALGPLASIALGGLLIVFSAWWIYFSVPAHAHLISTRQAIPWGYGHYVVFAAAAAIGPGIEVAVEHATGEAHVGSLTANAALTVPTAAYLVTVWLIHTRHHAATVVDRAALPLAALAVLAATFTGAAAVPLTGVLCAAATAVVVLAGNRRTEPVAPPTPA